MQASVLALQLLDCGNIVSSTGALPLRGAIATRPSGPSERRNRARR
jgi:hypothetical protein